MTTAKWTCNCVWAVVLLVGLASIVSAKKPPKDPPPPPPLPIRYVIEWLPENFGTEPRDAEFVYGELVVVGTDTDWDFNDRAFVYTEADGMMDITTEVAVAGIALDGITLTTAGCINDLGQIAGIYVKYDEDGIVLDEGIYVWDRYSDPPNLHTRSQPDVYWVYDISDGAIQPALPWDGTVVGRVSSSDGNWGFVWQPAQDPVDDFFAPLPIDPFYDASGINRFGEVVGRIPLSHGYAIYRYELDTGALEILSDTKKQGPTGYRPTGRFSWFRDRIDVNDNGIVAGNVEAKQFVVPAFYDGVWTELTLEEPGYTVAINNGDRICGITPVAGHDTPDTGFVYHPDHGYWSLNVLIAGNLEDPLDDPDIALWFSGDARDKCLPKGMTNDDSTGYGTIVGEKWLQGDPGSRGFVLRPVPPSQ